MMFQFISIHFLNINILILSGWGLILQVFDFSWVLIHPCWHIFFDHAVLLEAVLLSTKGNIIIILHVSVCIFIIKVVGINAQLFGFVFEERSGVGSLLGLWTHSEPRKSAGRQCLLVHHFI